MKNILSVFVALLLTCTSVQCMAGETEEDFSQLIYGPVFPTGHFDFEQNPEFSMIVLKLKNLIILYLGGAEGRIDRVKSWNHFCAVGYVFPDVEGRPLSLKEVVVYWKEDGSIMRWWGDDPELVKQNFPAFNP